MNRYELVLSSLDKAGTITTTIEAMSWFIDEHDLLNFVDDSQSGHNVCFAINAKNVVFVRKVA